MVYDYLMVWIFDEVGILVLLVGDLVVNVVYGYDIIVLIFIDELILLVCGVVWGVLYVLVVVDLLFGSYEVGFIVVLVVVIWFFKDGGVYVVKFEGGEWVVE